MTDIVLAIKKSQNTDQPTSLANGELAYSFSSDKLYIGQTGATGDPVSVEYIGGKLIVDKVANLESITADRTFNSVTLTTSLTVDSIIMSTFTENGLMYTNASGQVVQTDAGNEGDVMQAGSGGVPRFGELDGGSFTG